MDYDYSIPAPQEEQGDYIGGLVRHLKARLEEFLCVTVTLCDETTGHIQVEFQGHKPEDIAQALQDFRQMKVAVGERVDFYLRQSHQHEANDTIWSGLYHYIIV